jgi:hypothetical protein
MSSNHGGVSRWETKFNFLGDVSDFFSSSNRQKRLVFTSND